MSVTSTIVKVLLAISASVRRRKETHSARRAKSGTLRTYQATLYWVAEADRVFRPLAAITQTLGVLCGLTYGRARQIRMKVWAAMTAAVRVSRP